MKNLKIPTSSYNTLPKSQILAATPTLSHNCPSKSLILARDHNQQVTPLPSDHRRQPRSARAGGEALNPSSILKNILPFLLLFLPHLLAAQCDPQPEILNTNDCDLDDVSLALAADGSNEFCDGQRATVAIDESQSIDFDQFIYYWCDGDVDTIPISEQPATHVYNISDEDLCDGNSDSYFVTIIGIKFCGEEFSARTVAASLTINYRPLAQFDLSGTTCLEQGISPTNTSCNAETFLWDFGDGEMSTEENPSHEYDIPGTYTIRLQVGNGCGMDTRTQTIRVVQEPNAAFTTSAPDGCVSDVIDLDATVNSFTNTRWTITPNDTLAWCFTDTATMDAFTEDVSILFKRPGSYTIRLTGSNACGMEEETVTFEIGEAPVFGLNEPPSNCGPLSLTAADLGFSITGEFTSIDWAFTGADQTTASGADFGTVTFTQSGTAAVTVRSDCNPDGTTRLVDISIFAPQTVTISDPGEFCASMDTVRLTADPPGGEWSGSGITSDGRFVPSAAGNRTFTYNLGNAPCNDAESVTVLIKAAPLTRLSDAEAACDQARITATDLDFNITGDYESLNWTFTNGNPATATGEDIGTVVFDQSGTVSLTVVSDCGTEELTADVIVSTSQTVSIEPVDTLCAGSADVQLMSTPTGGSWQGTGVTATGTFSPSQVGAGRYTLTYALGNAPCNDEASTIVTVVNSATVTTEDATLCIDGNPTNLTFDPPGGVWSGTGITDATTGTFDPVLAGVAVHQPVYTFIDGNGCEVMASSTVIVEALPTLMGPDTLPLCRVDDALSLPSLSGVSGTPDEGNFSWDGPGTTPEGLFNSVAAGLDNGSYTISFTYTRNDCEVTDSLVVSISTPPTLTITGPDEVCIGEGTLTLTTNIDAGTWGGPEIDPLTGEINLTEAGGGSRTYTYEVATGTSCEQNASITVEIKDPAADLVVDEFAAACEGPQTFTLTGVSPGGGTWSGDALTDQATGTIDLTQLTPGESYTYTYCITDAAVADCEACRDQVFTYNPKPSAAFNISGPTCINERFRLDPTQPDLGYEWDFGDGNTSNSTNPEHSYTARGTYTIRLIVRTSAGCRDTSSQQLFISEPPVADFGLPVNEGCAPFTLQLEDRSSGDDITVRYLIEGDTLTTPTYVFDSITDDRWFVITQLVENACGLRTNVDSVLVHPYPLARFGVDSTSGCSPFTSELINVTLGNPDSFYWNLGLDNTILRDFEPELPPYTTPDDSVSVYTISLIATNECGVDTFNREITVFPPDVTAFIQLDTPRGCQPLMLAAESFSTPGSELSWTIIGPDGNQVSGGIGPRPDVPLDQPGVHTIILTATGCGSDADTTFVEVLPAPLVSFTNLPDVCLGESISFQNGSIDISASDWDFGDGNGSTDFAPTHMYDSAGVFTVTYTGFSQANNCPATVTGQVRVLGLPSSDFGPANASGCPGLTVNFTNASSGVGSLRYAWNFGDGSNESSAANPSHTFHRAGEFSVRLVAFDDAGCFSDTTFARVNIFAPPVASFTLSEEQLCLDQEALIATNTSGEQSVDWLIADQPFSGQTVNFQPAVAGAFTASQIVTNSLGCRDTSEQAFTVLPTPRALATADVTEICAEGSVAFSSVGTISTTSLRWEFGDATGSTEPEVNHVFSTPGDYTILLIAANANGCPADTATLSLRVNPNPVASFLVNKSEDCGAPATVSFRNTSTNNLSNEWTFGDGNTSTDLSPIHEYLDAGNYPVQLITVSEFGCRDTSTQEVDVFGRPVAEAVASSDVLCARDTLTVIASSTQAIRYEWFLEPDLQPRLGRIQQYTFADAGEYTINLIAIYNDQCRDTLAEPFRIRVFDRPVADFEYVADESMTVIGDVRFVNLSEGGDEFRWLLGDGSERTDFEFTHEYDLNRAINVTLIAATTNGGSLYCADTITKPVDPEWIVSFEVPDAVSPDYGDPAIREWGAVGSGVEAYGLRVYSPYGELIWSTESVTEGHPDGRWDGSIGGAAVPQGAYSWEANVLFVDGRRIRQVGTVTVLR